MVQLIILLIIVIKLNSVHNANHNERTIDRSINVPVITVLHNAIPNAHKTSASSSQHKLNVLPATSNMHQSSVHTNVKHIITRDNMKIPIVSQTVSHSVTNIEHPVPHGPVVIHNLLPMRDLSVIPLKVQKVPKLSLRMERTEDDVNLFRTFYGGYGTGLLFGGQGAGHGFYAYG